MINKVSHNIAEVLYRLNIRKQIDLDLLEKAFIDVLQHHDSQIRDVFLGSFLTGMMVKGPTPREIAILLRSAFTLDKFSPEKAIKIELPEGKLLVGTVGCGKKGIKTINISTLSALVASSLGAFIAKPGSSSTSSVLGSADFIREVGAIVDLNVSEMIKIIFDTGFGFFPMERLIPKFDKVYNGRFYAPHTLSFGLAALLTPIKFDTLLFGLSHPNIELSLKVLREFDVENAMVVSCTHDGIHFLDEIGIYGETKLIGMKKRMIGEVLSFYPTETLNLPRYSPKDIAQAKTKNANIGFAVNVLRGQGEIAHEDIVCINAGNLLYLSEIAEDLSDGYFRAKNAVKKKWPMEKLEEFIEATNGNKKILYKYL